MKNTEKEIKENSVRRILEAALTEFQKKGFEGARVDEIARQAGVNKALLYYYFESKEKILEAIFNEMKKDFVVGKSIALTSNLTDSDGIDNHLKTMDAREYMKDIVTVAFAESLKEKDKSDYLFELVDDVMFGILKEEALNKGKGLDVQSRIALFFFATMPEFAYIMLGEKWARHSNIEPNVFAKEFKEVYRKILTHLTKEIFVDPK